MTTTDIDPPGGVSTRRRRRRGGADLDPLVPAPSPDPARWLGPFTTALRASSGLPLSVVDGPTALAHHEGPWAFGCELAVEGGPLPADWHGEVVVRVADDPAEVAREAAAVEAVASAGLGAPGVLASLRWSAHSAVAPSVGAPVGREPTAGDPSAGDPVRREPTAAAALVTSASPGTPLPELIGFNLSHSEALLGGFAAHHAAVHDHVDAAALAGVVPEVSLADELGRIDGDRFGDELAWLAAHAPDAGPPVLCHGGYQPLCVSGPGPDSWGAVGGPGHGLVARNWCGAVLAERELDVAFTLVAFWFAPHFAPNRSERTAIKMIRNTLSNSYKLAYQAAAERAGAPLDAERLRFWQAFHAVRGMARVHGAYDAVGSPFAVGDRGPLPAVLGEELSRYFRMQRRG